ncbi:Uu.00g091670.m01.CDS01 [Anthostomella pinea]|uniref:Uu.00g091670.m01.CDS01 n=1 Tax=Anthostomella pinea TaxID=933095 RepID=A0AAI8YK99_9PEZI|nr:Uu.00g091670.m01.CDS01 [Anthostomella pinea]
MSVVLELPREYGYVLAVAASSLFINTYHFLLTAKARGASGITYPTPYASQEQADKNPKAYAFNVAQRAHSNYTENQAPFLTALLIAGLRFPTPSAWLGGVWVAARVWYAAGYTSMGPPGRVGGFVTSAAIDFALKVMAVVTGYKLAQGL